MEIDPVPVDQLQYMEEEVEDQEFTSVQVNQENIPPENEEIQN